MAGGRRLVWFFGCLFFFFFFMHVKTPIQTNRSDKGVLVTLLVFVLPDGNGLVTKD